MIEGLPEPATRSFQRANQNRHRISAAVRTPSSTGELLQIPVAWWEAPHIALLSRFRSHRAIMSSRCGSRCSTCRDGPTGLTRAGARPKRRRASAVRAASPRLSTGMTQRERRRRRQPHGQRRGWGCAWRGCWTWRPAARPSPRSAAAGHGAASTFRRRRCGAGAVCTLAALFKCSKSAACGGGVKLTTVTARVRARGRRGLRWDRRAHAPHRSNVAATTDV